MFNVARLLRENRWSQVRNTFMDNSGYNRRILFFAGGFFRQKISKCLLGRRQVGWQLWAQARTFPGQDLHGGAQVQKETLGALPRAIIFWAVNPPCPAGFLGR